jgi:hypothetical protein
MSLTNPVNIDRSTPAGNVLAGSSKTSGMIGHGVAVAGKIALKELKTFYSLADAEAAGIEKNGVNHLGWYHVKEFYRKAGKGTKLYFMLASAAHTTGTLNVKMVDLMTDATSEYAKKMLTEAEGSIYQLIFFMAPATGYVEAILNAMDSDSYNSIAAAQTLYTWADERNLACNMIIEGRNFSGTSGTAIDLRAIVGVKAHKATLVVGQDYTFASALAEALHKKHAAVGAFGGSVAYAAISQNAGEHEDAGLQVNDTENFVVPGLSNNTRVKDRFDDLNTLDTKGYVFPWTVDATIGVRWNGDHTCTPIELDSDQNMSEYNISLGRVNDEIRRRLRARLLPKIKTRQRIDPATGKLDPKTIESFNALGDVVFEDMASVKQGHISGGKTNVDPDSNLSVAPRILKVDYSWVPIGQIDEVKGTIKIKTKL